MTFLLRNPGRHLRDAGRPSASDIVAVVHPATLLARGAASGCTRMNGAMGLGNRRLLLVVCGAAVATIGSASAAVGLLSSPLSSPVGLSVYKQHAASAYSYNAVPGGNKTVSFFLDDRDILEIGQSPAIPPAGVKSSSSRSYSAYVSFCATGGRCTTQASSSGSFAQGELRFDPIAGGYHFQKQTPCGLVDVTFVAEALPLLGATQQLVPPLSAAASGDANARAFGTVCGSSLDTSNAHVKGSLTTHLSVPTPTTTRVPPSTPTTRAQPTDTTPPTLPRRP